MSRFGMILLSLGLLASAALLHGAELPPAETEALLKKLQAHRAEFPALTAEFTEEKSSRLLNKPLVHQGTLAFQAPNKFRRELKGHSPSLTVCDGQKLWIYYPNFKEAELYTMGRRAFFDDSIAALTAGLNFQNIGDYFRFSAHREGNGHRLVLTPKTGGLKRMLKQLQVWVDDEQKIERTEATLPKDDRVVTSYRDQRSTALPASTFTFTPPADARISEPLGK